MEMEVGNHAAQMAESGRQAFGTEEYPADTDEGEGASHTRQPNRGSHHALPTLHHSHRSCATGGTAKDMGHEATGVEYAPSHKGPSRTMPQTAECEDDKGIAHLPQTATARAAQRKVDVLAKPLHQRDVPASPEGGYVGGEIGKGEVAREANAEEACRANGNVGIAREVAVNLEGEEHGAHDEVGAIALRIGIDGLYEGSHAVGQQHLLDEAPQHKAQAIDNLGIAHAARCLHLRQKVLCLFYRACHQLRKEADKGGEGHGIATGGDAVAIHVNDVAQNLEGIETDTHGQDDAERGEVGPQTESTQETSQIFGKESVILEPTEHTDAHHHRGNAHSPLAMRLPTRPAHQATARESHGGHSKDKGQEAHVPPSVKYVACQDQQHILPRQTPRGQPIEQQHARQEN